MNPRVTRLLFAVGLSTALGTSAVAVGQERSARPEARAPGAADRSERANAAADEVQEGGEKVKVFKFTGLDISGRLKTPQLLYFLNRLRAEFERPRLPHRSFVPELERSTKERAF